MDECELSLALDLTACIGWVSWPEPIAAVTAASAEGSLLAVTPGTNGDVGVFVSG